jgi:signal transduction histidine kinase/ActR/RegA family two-component response regulator
MISSQEALMIPIEEALHTLIQNKTSIVWIRDREGRLTAASPGLEILLGLNGSVAPGKRLRDIFSAEAADEQERHDSLIFQTGAAAAFNETVQVRGEAHLFHSMKFPIVDEKGDINALGTISVPVNHLQDFANDPAERMKTEEEHSILQAQLIQAQKMDSIGRLAGGVAHDFNNMLGIIIGHLDLAMQSVNPSSPLFADLKMIEKAALRSADLTRQLLAFARRQPIAPRVLDLSDTVEKLLKMLRRLIREDVDLVWKPGHSLKPVLMDPTQIDQILANLIVNARDAIVGMGTIMIETSNADFDEAGCLGLEGCCPGGYVMLAVSDNGSGMEKEVVEHLFEPFFTTKGVGGGTGLGLATVYGIVRQNSGFIKIKSEPGKGTAFHLFLPAHNRAVPEREVVLPRQVQGGNETVLMVEDESSILETGRRMLEHLGYSVYTANSPAEAIKTAEEHAGEIRLLITDVIMPEMTGWELSEKLLTICPDLKVLFISGYAADVIARHGVLEEGVHFIQKPFTMRGLDEKISQALGRIRPE